MNSKRSMISALLMICFGLLACPSNSVTAISKDQDCWTGFSLPLKMFSRYFPKSKTPALQSDILNPSHEYWYCRKSGCLVDVHLIGDKSRFTVLLVPVGINHDDSVLERIDLDLLKSTRIDIESVKKLCVEKNPLGGNQPPMYSVSLRPQSISQIAKRMETDNRSPKD